MQTASRREVIQLAAALVAAGNAAGAAPRRENASGIARRPFGKTGEQVSMLALGGYHLGQVDDENEAIRIVHEAIDGGITFMDNAWEYNEHRSEELMGKALADRRDKVFLMTKVCTHGRDKKVAMKQLDESLKRLRTDHLDLWQVHEVVYESDPALHYAQGGVIEALDEAKKQGKVRFVGFTGHKSPDIHLDMLRRGYAFDSVQMPLNVFDASYRSFEKNVLPVAREKGMAVLGMKSLGGDGGSVRKKLVTVEEALRYVLSLPVTTLVSGIDSLEVLRQNLKIAREFKPMSPDDMEQLRKRVSTIAADGRMELFKSSMRYDADEGRAQHGFPSMKEMGG